MSSDKVSRIGIGNLDQKMEMLDELFEACIVQYHKPIAFMASVDAIIQGLRNYTFALQSNKARIPDFESWYLLWQDVMKKDSYMNWLNETRVKVVHGDVLTTKSDAILQLDTDHDQTLYKKHYDIMSSSQEMISDAIALTLRRPELKHAVGTIYRLYLVDVKGIQTDVMDIIAGALYFTKMMSADLIIYLEDKVLVKPQMHPLEGNVSFRTNHLALRFKLRDGSLMNEHIKRIERKDIIKDARLATERYGEVDFPKNPDGISKVKLAQAHFRIAKSIFEKDKNHMTMMHVHDKDGWSMTAPLFRDRAEKIAFWRSFAASAKMREIDEVVFTSEMWTLADQKKTQKHLRAGKELKTLRNKGELLSVQYLNKDGVSILISASINRDGDEVSLSEPRTIENDYNDFAMFHPLYEAWGLIKEDVSGDEHVLPM